MIALCYRTVKSLIFTFQEVVRLSEIYFRVSPGEREFSITDGVVPEVSLTEEAENGRANAELKERLEEVTGEEPGIVSGTKSRRKKLIFDQDEKAVRNKISEFSGEVQS